MLKDTNSNDENRIYLFSVNTVAYLKSYDILPLEMDVSQVSGKVMYWFDRSDDIEELIRKYKNDEWLRKFLECVRDTRDEIKKVNGIKE